MKTALIFVAVLLAQDPPKDDPRLAKFKSLAGTWEGEMQGGKATISYRVTAGGSAVEETIFAGTPHEMVTMYHMDGEDFVLTHYCMVGNQPKMKAAKEIKDGVLTFECVSVSNAKSHDDGHMHAAKFTFGEDGSLVTEWTFFADGEAGDTVKLSLKRKKE